jgi:hypothetical protein
MSQLRGNEPILGLNMNFAVEWTLSATEDEEDGMGDLVDLPICREEVQPRRLQGQSQPQEQLDEVIDEIIELMIISAEASNEGKLIRRDATTAKQQKQQ